VAVLIVALAAPAAALANGSGTCKASACKVYHESGGANSGGQKPPTQKPPTGSNQNGGGRQSQVPKSYSRVLQNLGKDKAPMKNLLAGDAAIGNLPNGSGGGSPSLFGAAFDLGAGPTALLAILLATALGLAARGSIRGWLAKRSSP
jgi:hypothetical protein